jgi:hypothetical protein
MLPLETKVNSSEYGIAISYHQIQALLARIDDLWSLLLMGNDEKNELVKKSDDDAILFDSSDIVIEFFDSSYWTITSINSFFINGVKSAVRHNIYPLEGDV